MSGTAPGRRGRRGFSMIELLVTVVLAGIIFAAMVPVFAGALKKSAADNNRVLATNLAQERMERIRFLRFADITAANLNSATIGPDWFKTTEPISGKTYTITTTTSSDAADAAYKKVTVDVAWPETTGGSVTTRHTIMSSIVKNPAAVQATTSTGGLTGGGGPGPWDVTVSFKNWNQADGAGQGVSIIRTVPAPATTFSPSMLRPNASQQTINWQDVPGGLGITYVVRCVCDTGTYTTPAFHLLSDAPDVYFDTDPGN